MTGTLVTNPEKKPKTLAGAKNLPEYDASTRKVRHPESGEMVDAPEGTEFHTDDGKVFVLHHERTIPGGWKRQRASADAAETTTAQPEAVAEVVPEVAAKGHRNR